MQSIVNDVLMLLPLLLVVAICSRTSLLGLAVQFDGRI